MNGMPRSGLLIGAVGGAVIAGLGVWLGLRSNPAPATPVEADAAAVLAELRADLEAGLRRWYDGDPSGYAGLYADDMSYFDPGTEAALRGLDALRAYFAPLEGQIEVERYEIHDDRLQLHGDIAIFTFLLSEYDEAGTSDLVWRVKHVYRRDDHAWRVIHGHFSQIESGE